MGCLIFTFINVISFPMCGSGRLSPAPPLGASGKPPGALPPWGRSSRGTSLEECMSFRPLLHSCTGFSLLITLPASPQTASSTLY